MSLPAGYRERTPRPGDADPIRAIANAGAREVLGVPAWPPDWPQSYWTAPAATAADFVVVEAPDGTIAGYGGVDAVHPYVSVFGDGVTAPAHRGRGIGTALVRGNEERARRYLPLAPRGARVALLSGVLAADAGATALLTANGYVEARRHLRMIATFDDAPEAPRLPPDVVLAAFRPGRDERPVHEVFLAAFADHWGDEQESFEEWSHGTYEAADFDPGLWLLAWDGDDLAGFVGCRERSAEDPGRGHVRVLGVQPAHRRRGLGEALLRAAFGELHRRGRTGVDLGVDSQSLTGADRLYRRVGMHGEPRFAHWERELRPAAPKAGET
jgi:mycothiol synthase